MARMSAPLPAPVRLFQIAYSPPTLASLQPGFEPLDNLANPRPDWYEFDPIRRFLLTQALDEASFYGFFSPKFTAKTGWHAGDVRALAQGRGATADVLLFSPHPNQGAFFVNVFEQGEFFHPGLLAAARAWLADAGIAHDPATLLMDARHTVFCNFFVARPMFWRAWLALGQTLWDACESPDSGLAPLLTASTSYTGGAQMKIFLMERMASLLLALQPGWKSLAADPYIHGRWPSPALAADPTDAVVSCALKHALRDTGWLEYRAAFGQIRQRVLQGAAA